MAKTAIWTSDKENILRDGVVVAKTDPHVRIDAYQTAAEIARTMNAAPKKFS
jgi:hypothetical protein